MATDAVGERLPRRGSSRWLNPLVTVRVAQVALWLLVASGPVAAALLTSQVSALAGQLDAVGGQAVSEPPPDTAGVEGFAELFVADFLGAGEDSLQALAPFLDGASLDGVTDGSWSARRTTSLGASEIGPGYFAVTVAADVFAADPDSDDLATWLPAGTRFYIVGVAQTDAGLVATGLPALAPAPARAVVPEMMVQRFDGLDELPALAEMVPRFLAAYLAGDGELARYVVPSSDIVPVRPPPFVDVEILRAGSVGTNDGSRQVALVVRATDTAGRAQVLEYSLTVGQRDGRWEVSELLPAPLLAP